ncbi:MAG: AI-2E family transporter, partial [candidate division Zixibacteria bacterium]|nr:AI-2E family transporter [candidate division Zixibacteria bacterium]NIS46162.1 AI-2E family transporter [candidate division Zixibacteria bacterium]NIU14268.1 AI-2E family transporter [candidate division Zixibacteria bacterium]NIV06330.1 AI-2E family transporter [candidate division Zixibacteria bacterium]NIW45115.1 AI-2E family transporter [Gammaproteobacteria bacterium]
MNVTKPRWSPQTKLTISILMLGLGIYLLYRFAEVIPPMILAIILAYILSPIVNFLWRKLHIHRVLAIVITYLLFLVVIVAVPWLLIPLLV